MNTKNEKFISVVIPNYNRAPILEKCLEAAFMSRYGNFEVIVVDDCSDDGSLEVAGNYPCRTISLKERSGTSRARNAGALGSRGEYIFFTDSDCLLKEDTLSVINETLDTAGPGTVVGGTYTRMSCDEGFFNVFQSVFVNYSETKKTVDPDYVAAHAMVINAETFRKSGGFPEVFLPIIEDVEFSHRLKRSGCRFVVNPRIEVRHIFGFSLLSSLRNAFRKSFYWNVYSLFNKDVLNDSGSASFELKANTASFLAVLVLLSLWFFSGEVMFLYPAAAVTGANAYLNRRLFRAFYETRGVVFGVLASMYYTMLYPLPVGMGGCAAVARHLFGKKKPFTTAMSGARRPASEETEG